MWSVKLIIAVDTLITYYDKSTEDGATSDEITNVQLEVTMLGYNQETGSDKFKNSGSMTQQQRMETKKIE